MIEIGSIVRFTCERFRETSTGRTEFPAIVTGHVDNGEGVDLVVFFREGPDPVYAVARDEYGSPGTWR